MIAPGWIYWPEICLSLFKSDCIFKIFVDMTRRRQNGTRWNNKKAHTWKPGSYYGTWPNDAKIHHVEFEIFLFCGIGLDKVVEEVWHNPDNSKSSLAIERLQVRALRRSRPAGSMVEYSTTVKGLFFILQNFCPYSSSCVRVCAVFHYP